MNKAVTTALYNIRQQWGDNGFSHLLHAMYSCAEMLQQLLCVEDELLQHRDIKQQLDLVRLCASRIGTTLTVL
jgi:hypothetical protein